MERNTLEDKNVQNFKATIEKLDSFRPRIDQVDYAIMNRILNESDFTGCKNTMESMNLFYEQLWAKMVFPYEEEIHIKNREIGRLIIEADIAKRKQKKYEKQIDSVRKCLQKEGSGTIEEIRNILFCEGSSVHKGDS